MRLRESVTDTLRDKVLQRLREALAHHETCEYSNCPRIGNFLTIPSCPVILAWSRALSVEE